jgi:chromosome segregation protein
MLQALELFGFKSFADKTRFEFPPGITVVVGPNGSGKSNIVDAIKWVLGAQSAKGLRGQEMADVIFKGSAGSGRRPMNTAEATLVFDNLDNRLPVDAPEVHVTRRVYRSGEGEYMINGNPCRLRDIKDLFSGTGLGAGAYSLIEQGKVDSLLQASAKDRRAIFEEAAGISRFKTKKLEAQRRLERVDQNLLRLSDIVDEVESRLRSVRAQAAKARRYREYTTRLQELRIQVAQVDWRKLTDRLRKAEEEVGRLKAEISRLETESAQAEAGVRERETRVEQIGRQLDDIQAAIAQNRQSIAAGQSTTEHRRRQCEELEAEQIRYRLQAALLQSRAGDVQQRLEDTLAAFERASREHAQIQGQLKQHEQKLGQLTDRAQQIRSSNESCRQQHMQNMREAATLASQITSGQSQVDAARETVARSRQLRADLEEQCRTQAREIANLQAAEQALVDQIEACRSELLAQRQQLDQGRRRLADRQQSLSDLQGRHSGAAERAAVIEELEERLEGVGAGVKETLRRAHEEPEGPFGEVLGLVADALDVEVVHAGMVEVALGDAAHHLVVHGHRLMTYLQTGRTRIPGRVGFVPLTVAIPRLSADLVDLTGRPGVLGRADRFVQCPPDYTLLVRRLLGRTWFVQTLAHAVTISQSEGRGLRFVTAAGELLEADGTLVVGHGAGASGIISRRSELASVKELVRQLESQILAVRQEVEQQQSQVARQEQQVEKLVDELEPQNAALAEHRVRIQNSRQRHAEADKQLAAVERDLNTAEAQQKNATEELGKRKLDLQVSETRVAELEQQLQADTEQLKKVENQRQETGRLVTQAQIDLAKSEQRLRGLGAAKTQCEQSRQERADAIAQCRQQLATCAARHQKAEREILAMQAELAEEYLEVESLAERARSLVAERESRQQQRVAGQTRMKNLRQELHDVEQRQHKKELSAGQIGLERRSLADRLRDEYGIELDQLQHDSDPQHEHQREEVDEEIASLRRKISNIGAVNLQALDELDEMEDRYESLSVQYQDLQSAKASLERIISKINADSRRLFSETLESVREYFQALFRKVFGGGSADIVLEDEADVLESGIEVVATPPGKQALPLSLLSGGERALTAVTLFMALFQFRPSPFCVLDEVDGPLDEANIGRFIDVLRGFLDRTRFVIVTHSKKTMTAATTLYGVTMQESGVSKRVSVRFEDVSDSGHISQDAIERAETEQAREKDERGAA